MKVTRVTACLMAAAFAACTDQGPSARPGGEKLQADAPVMAVACEVLVGALNISCRAPSDVQGIGRSALLVGRQNVHVKVTTSSAVYTAVDSTFSFDLTVQNLIPQTMGTADGTTPHANGVRVFFSSGPTVTGGSGVAEVRNPTGIDAFTTAAQPYVQYSGSDLGGDGMLSPNETSASKQWRLRLDPGVTSFAFYLLISAEVQYPSGYIEVTPGVDSILEGTTASLSGTVRDAFGEVVPGQTITWGTSAAGVGTVDANGVVSGVAPGSVTITATSGARSGAAAIAVCPNLSVGEVYTAVMPAASSLCFGAPDAGAAEYTYMPINQSASSALSLSILATGIQAVTGPPSPNMLVPELGFGSAAIQRAAEDKHVEFLARDKSLGESLLRRGKSTLIDRRRDPMTRALIVPGVPAVGDLWQLNVASGCSGARDDRVGRVRSVGQHVIIVADTLNPAGGFTTAQYDSIALEFDSLAYKVDTANFGGPTDLDTNTKVVAFYTRAVNELSPPASSAIVLGYFTARDLFSSAPTSCPRSNEGEIFYMLVPDPTGAVNSNVRTVSSVRGQTVGTMAHELQHLINASRRIYIKGTQNFEVMREGLAHVSEELMFYLTSVGLSPRGNIIVTQLTTGLNASRRVAAFNTYANSNYGRFRSWLQRPDTAGSFKDNDALAVRGVTWAFLRYAADRKGGTQATTWFDLVNTDQAGKTNLQTVFGGSPDDWQRDFTAAMYADDAVAGIGSSLQQPSWDFRSVYGGLGGFPLGTRALSNGVQLTLSYSRGGGTAYGRFGIPSGGFAGVTALSGGVAPTSPYALIVVRSK